MGKYLAHFCSKKAHIIIYNEVHHFAFMMFFSEQFLKKLHNCIYILKEYFLYKSIKILKKSQNFIS